MADFFYAAIVVLQFDRYKNELERSQPAGSCSSSSTSSELMSYTTPQKSFPTPASATAQRQQGIHPFSMFYLLHHSVYESSGLLSALDVGFCDLGFLFARQQT